MLDAILIDLSNFLAIRTLALSPTKTEIKHITEGISFIGWFIKKSGNVDDSVMNVFEVIKGFK